MLKHINKEHEGVEENVEFSFEVIKKQKKLSFALDKNQIGFRTSEFSLALFLV